jgi:glucose/arabinose dehydrogenase
MLKKAALITVAVIAALALPTLVIYHFVLRGKTFVKAVGNRITLFTLNESRAVDDRFFARGWRHEDETQGRPADLLVLPDGSLLVSDDKAGALYPISYVNEQTRSPHHGAQI